MDPGDEHRDDRVCCDDADSLPVRARGEMDPGDKHRDDTVIHLSSRRSSPGPIGRRARAADVAMMRSARRSVLAARWIPVTSTGMTPGMRLTPAPATMPQVVRLR
jgi:hypothetical protein